MFTRRTLLKSTASGFGYVAFAALAHEQAARAADAANPLAPKKPHFTPRAKRVIFLCMDGAPSHVDTFDYKPKLTADSGKPPPAVKGIRTFGAGNLLGSPFQFKQHGNSGLWVSELFPELAKHADDLCVVNGMHTDLPNHPQAFLQMHCGIFQFPRPSLGAWALYGLGTENANLPGFLTLNPPLNNGGPANYGSSFLPAVYQGTKIGGRGPGQQSVSNIKNPKQSMSAQRVQLDFVQQLNRSALEQGGENPGIEGLIDSYELAFRMQGELPKLMDLSKETAATQKRYGLDEPRPATPAGANFGRACLLARRFVEAGVRFVEITMPGWDQHRNLKDDLTRNCTTVDKPIAGLLADLKARDMLKDTLVIWGGEFGRTPYAQGPDGRDHNSKGYSIWMAGGGTKGGINYGKTDDYGFEAVEDRMHVHDWHATILHLLGLDHEKLTYRYAGREMRLTDVKGTVAKGVLA
jgi:hypothetical protein